MEQSKLTQKIIGCAFTVYNKMGSGFLESVYENCMMIEPGKEGLPAENQKPLKVTYDGEIVGDFMADILVGDEIIVVLI